MWLTTKAFTENEQPAQTQQASMTAGFWKNLLHKVQKATNKILKTYYGLSYWAKLLNFIKQLSTLTLYILKTLKFRFFGTLVILQFVLACWFHFSSDAFVDGWHRLEGREGDDWLSEFTILLKKDAGWLHSICLPIISIDSNETVWLPNKADIEMQSMLAGVHDVKKWWEEQGEGLSLINRHLKGMSARGVHLPKLILNDKSDLRGAVLISAQLRNACLSNAQLEGVDFRFADLRGSEMSYAKLKGAMLQNAKLESVDMEGVKMDEVKLDGVELEGVKSKLEKNCKET